MPVSKDLLNAKFALIRLKGLSEQMEDISEVFVQLKGLSTILGEQITQNITYEIRNAVESSINEVLNSVLDEATISSIASEMEVNTKIKNIAPVIAGIPVILPPPTEYGVEEGGTIALATSIGYDFINMTNNFKKTLNQWHLL